MGIQKWSRAVILERIAARQRQGLPMDKVWQDDQALAYSTYRYFGSWRAALRAAGVAERRVWSRQQVIDSLRARHAAALPMTNLSHRDSPLAAAAGRYFGSYENALLAAGLPPVRRRKRLTKQEVLNAFRQRHEQGLPLVRFWLKDLDLRAAVRKHFGSWRSVVQAAKIPLAAVNRWDRQRVIAGIQACHGKRQDTKLYSAAREHCGSWPNALRAAGYNASVGPPRRWSRQSIIDELQHRHRRGLPMTLKQNGALARAALRYFGTWSWALTVAKVPRRAPQRNWSRETVLHELESLKAQGVFEESSRIPDTRLASAASRHFGSKRQALIAAGILEAHRHRRCRTKWSRRRIVEAFQNRHITGQPLRGDANLVSAAARHFGSVYQALLAAGLRTPEPRRRIRWDAQLVISELQRRHKSGLPLRPTDDSRLMNAARRYFGRWHDALAAAGLSLNESRPESYQSAKKRP